MRVIYFDIDSLRADHLGCYGYCRATSPNIDRVAREGMCFDRLYASDSPCVPSRATFMTGKFGIHHGAVTHWGPGSEFRYPGLGHTHREEDPVFPRLLHRHGIRTVTFSSFADRHQAWWYAAGWKEHHAHTLKGGGESAAEVNAAVLPWLKANGKQDNWFLHVQYWDPHRPYHRVSEEQLRAMSVQPMPPWPDEAAIATHQRTTGPFSAVLPFSRVVPKSPFPAMPDRVATLEDARHFISGYDAAVRSTDDHVGQILDLLAELGLWEETAVVVSADHGEALGEQGVYGDHCCASECVHRLPAVVRWPGVAAPGARSGAMAFNADLQATLVDLLGLPVPQGWDGRSLAPAVRGEALEGRPHLVWSHALYSCQRVVRTPRWQYVRTYHPGLFAFPPSRLYDMDADPHETRDVAAENPGVVCEHERLLEDWRREMLKDGEEDPMRKVIETGPWKYVKPGPWLETLREAGREDLAAALLRRLREGGFRADEAGPAPNGKSV
jgi:arylsulfatase A-like enzyme